MFWTTIVSGDSVRVDLEAGTATLEVHDLRQKDYFTFENAILGNGPRPKQGAVSFEVRWTANGPVSHYDNPAQQFRGDFRSAVAQMEWSGQSGVFDFYSAPLAQSTTDFAELGREGNGCFYVSDDAADAT